MIKPVRRKPLAPSGPLLAAPVPSGGLGITRMRSRASRAVCGSGFGSCSSSPGSAAADQGGREGNPGAPCATSPGGCGLGAARARCDLRGGDTRPRQGTPAGLRLQSCALGPAASKPSPRPPCCWPEEKGQSPALFPEMSLFKSPSVCAGGGRDVTPPQFWVLGGLGPLQRPPHPQIPGSDPAELTQVAFPASSSTKRRI